MSLPGMVAGVADSADGTGTSAADYITQALVGLRAALPEPRPMTTGDIVLGHLLVAGHIMVLVSPPTPRWRLIRAAIAPFIAAGWLWLGYVPLLRTRLERWGSSMLFFHFAFRVFEHLVCFPPEFEVFRLRPVRCTGREAHSGGDGKAQNGASSEVVLAPEPIPQPWTWAKVMWATSLWWSWRGIGWNYAPPLAASMREEPYTRTSSWKHHVAWRACYLAGIYAVDDLAATYMRVALPEFFVTRTLAYADLTTVQRAAVSIATVTRILAALEYTHVGLGMAAVTAGAQFGLEGELFEPWGWPPMFGSLPCIWQHPGLNHMWARSWNQYHRRMNHIWVWVGFSERVLGLPPSGKILATPAPVTAHKPVTVVQTPVPTPSRPAGVKPNGAVLAPTPPVSGTCTPMGGQLQTEAELTATISPLPTPPASPPPSALRAGMATNLLKSVLVFTFSGVFHDYSSVLMLLDAIGRGEKINPWDIFSLAPFFVVQPIAIAIEALWVPRYRAFKRARGITRGNESALLVFAECALSFAWVWVWLGWSARWFVEGMARIGVWPVFQPWPFENHFTVFAPMWAAMRRSGYVL